MTSNKTVADELVGALWPASHPAEDPVTYGHVTLDPSDPVEVRSAQSFKLIYNVGRYGIDDTGAIRIVWRYMGDQGDLQTHDPKAYNYVTAQPSNNSKLRLSYGKTAGQRPWLRSLTIQLHGGYLREGDTITVNIGDTSGGSPGLQMQTMVERGFEFKVLADVCATGHFVPLAESPSIEVVPGSPQRWKAVISTLRRPGEKFEFGLKAEDLWGNPTPHAQGRFKIESTLPVKGLPSSIDFPVGEKSLVLEDLSVETEGELRIRVINEAGTEVAQAGPMMIRNGDVAGYWGDLHGQSGESIGITTSRDYFNFARNLAFLEVSGHQANDFQVNNAFWKYLNELTAEYQEDHRFVVFPGYEWSGNTSVGGDRNVFFKTEGRQIRRSSHALIADRSDIKTDATTANDLFEALKDEDCTIYAHVGGRYADIKYAHDPKLETAMEIHSAWGTFEWLLTDGFPEGHRSGVVCNSDGHKGRPGASYPGTSMFGAYGGLTCFIAKELTRDGIFEAMRRRHHYGTTGCRLHMDVSAHFDKTSTVFERDPNAFDNPKSHQVNEVMMGDIVKTDCDEVEFRFTVKSPTPIERIEIRNGTDVLTTVRPYKESELGNRIRVVWSGSEYRGRGRQSTWTGRARFNGAKINKMSKINAWNHERLLEQTGMNTVEFDAITTGNFGGFDAWLDTDKGGSIDLTCNHGEIKTSLSNIGFEDTVLDVGGLERKIKVFRLPEENTHREVEHVVRIPIRKNGDNPLWIAVTTEDGFQAWSSPIFVFK